MGNGSGQSLGYLVIKLGIRQPRKKERILWFFECLVSIQWRTNRFLHSVLVAVTIFERALRCRDSSAVLFWILCFAFCNANCKKWVQTRHLTMHELSIYLRKDYLDCNKCHQCRELQEVWSKSWIAKVRWQSRKIKKCRLCKRLHHEGTAPFSRV